MGKPVLYVPWADDVVLCGESPYALVNKLAWFSGRGPVQLIRDLRAYEKLPPRTEPFRIDFRWPHDLARTFERLPHLPRIHGMEFVECVRRMQSSPDHLFEFRITADTLRFCPACLSLGMHFAVGQLKFIEHCPYHQVRLVSHCPECGETLPYACELLQAAFSCNGCGTSLLNSALTDIRANLRERWNSVRQYMKLMSAVQALPHTHLHVLERHALGKSEVIRLQKVVTKLVGATSEPAKGTIGVTSPFSAVRIDLNERGKPRLRHVSEIAIRPCRIQGKHPLEASFLHLAQLRVGAWVLQHFRDHAFCIGIARDLLRNKVGSNLLPRNTERCACCIAQGFAAWEAGRRRRLTEGENSKLWDAWKITSRAERLFAHYILEKAWLSNAILLYVQNDATSLRSLEISGFKLELYDMYATSCCDADNTIILADLNRMDLTDTCDLHFRPLSELTEYLRSVLPAAFSFRDDESMKSRIEQSGRELCGIYGAATRAGKAAPWMHEEINIRLQPARHIQS